jgi:hypothetical protein
VDRRLERTLLALLLAMCALVACLFLLDEPPASRGFAHPEVATMERGGDGADRLGSVLWLGWGLGLLEIGFFVALIALGARSRGGLRGLGRPLWYGLAAFAGLWTALVLGYRSWVLAAPDSLWLALPSPTAIMLYAIWPMPVLFIGLYAMGFSRWIYTEEDRRRFEALLSQRRVARNADEAE